MSAGMTRLDAAFIQKVLPQRLPTDHKGRFGTLGVLAGSRQYRGAAVLAVGGALAVGTGMVRLAAIEPVCAAAAAQLPCCTLLPLGEDAGGGIAEGGAARLLALGPAAVLAGCGLGATRSTARLVEGLLHGAGCPLVLDADALNVLAARPQLKALLRQYAAQTPVVLTPHPGEMARLCGQTAAGVLEDPKATAAAAAKESGCVVVLKSHATVVAGPGGGLYHYDEGGNPGLAKGGSGDVLAGIIAGLCAQGVPAEAAAAAGVWLHAQAGRLAADEVGYAALSPAALSRYLAPVLKGLGK